MTEALTTPDLRDALAVYCKREEIPRRRGEPLLRHILYIPACGQLADGEVAMLVELGERLDQLFPLTHLPALTPLPLLDGGTPEVPPSGYDAKLQVILRLKDGQQWYAEHKKWNAHFQTLVQAVGKLYNRLLLAPGYWACTERLVPREVRECQHRHAHQTPQGILLEGHTKKVASFDLWLTAPTQTGLESMIARLKAKAG